MWETGLMSELLSKCRAFHEALTQRKACREIFLCDDDVPVTFAQFRLITNRMILIESFIRKFNTSRMANDTAKRVSEGHMRKSLIS
jgi:hypothetical protein